MTTAGIKQLVIALIVCSLIGPLALPVRAQGDTDPTAKALEYLLTTQHADGGFGTGWTPDSDISTTADVVIAAVLAGDDPEALFADDLMDPLSYLAAQVEAGSVQLAGAGSLAKVLMAVTAVGEDATAFGGTDLVAELLAAQSDSGYFGAGGFEHCLAMIALQNAGVDLPENTVEVLLDAQNGDGGWGFMPGELSDTNTTGLCLQSLALVDAPDEVTIAFDYLASIQNEDGGWPYQNPSEYGTDSDTNSTALVVGALIAHGYDLAEWNDPQAWLMTMQNESGAFGYQAAVPDDNIVATTAAIPAVLGVPLTYWALALAVE